MPPVRANYHTHCEFCDGRATAAEMARAAFAAGYRVLGFSSHCPLPFPSEGNMELSRLGEYKAEVRRLGREWGPRGLEILLGMEIDLVPGFCSPTDPVFAEAGLDYAIGSVHYVELPGPGRFPVDYDAAAFARFLSAYEGEEPGRAAYEAYYALLGTLIEEGGFDILGHFDLVKKNNDAAPDGSGRWFDESSKGYLDAALGAARLLAGRDMVVEINVGGIARGKTKEPYPSLPILRELRSRGVPITFSADAHAPEHLGANLDAARQFAEAAGYDSVRVLTKGTWKDVGIGET
jgi:histidinol-phosphatase (PHP family)